MSSVKRSNLTSSELGQLKAPDKWETPSATTTSSSSSATKTSNALAANSSEVDTMSSSAAKSQAQQQSRDAQKPGTSTQQVTKNLELDENQLKNLLDEAYSYKGPKDKENKSDIFKELLHKAELEDQQQDTLFSSRQFRGNSRRHHTGGSLQDLVDSVNNEQLLDCDYILGSQSRRHQQNSRYTKNSSSVSSRQREGGSLPNNVNSPCAYTLSSLSIAKNPKVNAKNSTKLKTETYDDRNSINHHRNAFIAESVSSVNETQSSIPSTSTSILNASDKNHTIINIDDPEEARHLLAHDSLAQDTSDAHRDDGTELVPIKKQRAPMMSGMKSNLYRMKKDNGEPSRQPCTVDSPISFLKCTPTNVSDPLMPSAVFAKSAIDPKYAAATRHVPVNPINKLDENGNAILPQPTSIAQTSNPKTTKTKRGNKADRNYTKTWTVEKTEFSDQTIDSIVAFIENKEISKKTNIINVNKNNLSVTERTRKEKKNTKKDVNQLKKSTSMEELKSSSKIEEEIAQSERAQVSLRQKQLQNAQKRTVTIDSSKQQQQQQPANKRGERRSWGTEELNDFDLEYRDAKKHKDLKPSVKHSGKKSEQITSTNASIESIPTNIEAAEFHVVTKKKKTKKRQILEEAKAKQQQQRDQQLTHGRNNNTTSSCQKYQPSSTYTNDRDIYVNSPMTKENRRKSTSSVPPSEKSDSSDLDSVHSLPIESTTNCTSSSIISYAEMARKANQPEKLSNVNAWPTVSQNGKINESPDILNISASSSTVSSKSGHAPCKSHDTIKATSPIEEKPAVNLDDSKGAESPKSQTTGSECVKNQLQKSKSCDNEKYSTTMNMDQFPGLEKTVKPQKSHPNFASVLTSQPPPTPPATTTTSSAAAAAAVTTPTPSTTVVTSDKVKVPSAKKSPTSVEANVSKDNWIKAQKSVEEKIDSKLVESNCSKLQFVQNSAKAEEIANSDSSNLFAPINMKKAKKSQQHVITAQRTARQTAVIFSDRETNHENVSPLLFGDFNDDILLLMKQEENHVGAGTANGPTSTTDSSASNCTKSYECAEHMPMNDCNQSKPNILTPMMSSQSDPGYTSAHCTTAPTESHEVVDQVHTENHIGSSTITELSSKKSNVTKKTNLNKINVNNKTSDVDSNQSLNNNNNMINNNISLGHAMAKSVGVSQSISESDSLNNNINIQMTDKMRKCEHVESDVIRAQQMHNNVVVASKTPNAQHNVNNTVSKNSNQPAANYQQKGIITNDSVNSKTLDNISNGPKSLPSSNKFTSTENEVVPVNSHPANVPHNKIASYVESRLPPVAPNHNHNDIVNFVGNAWEEVKYGRASYFSGQ